MSWDDTSLCDTENLEEAVKPNLLFLRNLLRRYYPLKHHFFFMANNIQISFIKKKRDANAETLENLEKKFSPVMTTFVKNNYQAKHCQQILEKHELEFRLFKDNSKEKIRSLKIQMKEQEERIQDAQQLTDKNLAAITLKLKEITLEKEELKEKTKQLETEIYNKSAEIEKLMTCNEFQEKNKKLEEHLQKILTTYNKLLEDYTSLTENNKKNLFRMQHYENEIEENKRLTESNKLLFEKQQEQFQKMSTSLTAFHCDLNQLKELLSSEMSSAFDAWKKMIETCLLSKLLAQNEDMSNFKKDALASQQKQLEEFQQELSAREHLLQTLGSTNESLKTETQHLQDNIQSLQLALSDSEAKHESENKTLKMTYEQQVHELTRTIETMSLEQKQLEHKFHSTAAQDKACIEQLQQDLQTKTAKWGSEHFELEKKHGTDIAKLENTSKELHVTIDSLNHMLSDCNMQLDSKQAELEKMTHENDRLLAQVTLKQQELDALQTSLTNTTKHLNETLQEKQNSWSEKLSKMEGQIKFYQAREVESKNEQDRLHQEHEETTVLHDQKYAQLSSLCKNLECKCEHLIQQNEHLLVSARSSEEVIQNMTKESENVRKQVYSLLEQVRTKEKEIESLKNDMRTMEPLKAKVVAVESEKKELEKVLQNEREQF
ncbi:viral A-type inclusion protein, partial [Reticulomyxa filosa]